MMLRKFSMWITIVGALAMGGPHAYASGALRAGGQYFRDSRGRPVLLNGINVSSDAKTPPFKPLQNLVQLKLLKNLGYNNIRLIFIWEAFEPIKGEYNLAYLDEITKVVDAAGRLGIYTVLDFHMDGFSRFTIHGCGCGSPIWAVPHPDTLHPDPENDKNCRYWNFYTVTGYYLFHNGFREAFDAFYSDAYGARSRYLAALHVLAKQFRKYPMMIGYDLLNEPWGDERTELGPLYEDAAKAIRAEDPQAIVFLEPANVRSDYATQTKLQRPSFENFAYASHHYDSVAILAGAWFDGAYIIDHYFEKIKSISRKWNAPIYVGEYGVTSGEGYKLRDLLRHYFKLYDENFISAAQWSYAPTFSRETGDRFDHDDTSIIDENGKLRKNFILRPHVAAVSGIPGRMIANLGENLNERSLEFEWEHDPNLGSTDFMIPPGLLSKTGKISFHSENPDLGCEFNSVDSELSCRSKVPGKKKITILELPSLAN